MSSCQTLSLFQPILFNLPQLRYLQLQLQQKLQTDCQCASVTFYSSYSPYLFSKVFPKHMLAIVHKMQSVLRLPPLPQSHLIIDINWNRVRILYLEITYRLCSCILMKINSRKLHQIAECNGKCVKILMWS